MARTAPHYLKACFAAFQEVSRAKYGTPFDLPAIERTVAPLRSLRTLTYQDLQYFEAKEHWWFERFWVFPPEHRITPALEKRTFDLWNLPKNEAEVIPELLDVFKSIELVSIILRFVKPEAYGIISPPVERVLDVRRGSDAVETYRNYLTDLREIARVCAFGRTAHADMALWVLHERCFGEHRDPEVERAWRTDPLFLRLRAKNLVLPLAELSYPKLAEALHHVKPDLATLVACQALEALIREAGKLLAPSMTQPRAKLEDVIDALPNWGKIDELRKAGWKRLKGVRNDLFHDGQQPTPKEMTDLIQEVVRLEEDLALLRAQGASRPRGPLQRTPRR